MNCKPGELAIVVRTNGDKVADELLGRCFEVVRIVDVNPFVGPRWEVKPEYRLTGETVPFDIIADCILKPIRDPGDDAKDELLRPLPQEVTA